MVAAVHDLEHHVAPQALAAREKHRGEIAGRDFLDDAVAGHVDRRRVRGRRDCSASGRQRAARRLAQASVTALSSESRVMRASGR